VQFERKTAKSWVLTLLIVSLLLTSIASTMTTMMLKSASAANPADFNGDGIVDMGDVARVASAFGTHAPPPTDPRWNATYDLNHDGWIDIADMAIVARYFGK
jgi:Ca2+-binding EF-hand superfamily protein